MSSLIFPQEMARTAVGAMTPASLGPLLRGVLAHLAIQGAYIFEHMGNDVVCERRLWHLTDQGEPSETIATLVEAIGRTLASGATAPDTLRRDFKLYVLENSSRLESPLLSARKRFDILDLSLDDAYEIKPDSPQRRDEGRRYLQRQIALYNGFRLANVPLRVTPLKPGRWAPPPTIPAGLNSWLRVRLASPGLITYEFTNSDDDSIQALRDAIRDQSVINILLAGLAAAAVVVVWAGSGGRAPVPLPVPVFAAISPPMTPLIRLGAGSGARPAAPRRLRPFRLPWTDPARDDAPPIPVPPEPAGPPPMRPQPPPPASAPERPAGGTPDLPEEDERREAARLLARELVLLLPDGLARDEDSLPLMEARIQALASMLEAIFSAYGTRQALTRLAGPDADIAPQRLADPVVLNAIACRVNREFAPRTFAILDWLTFAPDEELAEMLAPDADEEP